eukprot:scaffold11058_cov90-Isochrysis_galbana.AAC.1
MAPPESASLLRDRWSTLRLMSRCSRRPKSLNMVEPPESTMCLYRPRRQSIGEAWMVASTTCVWVCVWGGRGEGPGWSHIPPR